MQNFLELQANLKFNFVDYDLGSQWKSHFLIESIRQNLGRFMPKGGLYDPQDLEHQVLFRLTTYAPNDITDRLVGEVVEEQYCLVKDRVRFIGRNTLKYLLRGLSGEAEDLNIFRRLEIKKEDGDIGAVGDELEFLVRFGVVDDPEIVQVFTEGLHYIHQARCEGESFGLFFENDDLPFLLETTMSGKKMKQYKRNALLAFGFDPDRAVELTRLYCLPGSPRNAISVLDGLVSDYYRKQGIQVLVTTTMPMYSKTKGATIAGGLNNVLLIKDTTHFFIEREIGKRMCYQAVTRDCVYREKPKNVIRSHLMFPLLPTVEVFMPLSKPVLAPLPETESKVIYVSDRERS